MEKKLTKRNALSVLCVSIWAICKNSQSCCHRVTPATGAKFNLSWIFILLFALCIVNVITQYHLQGILLYLVQAFTWSQGWTGPNLEVKGQGHSGFTNQFFGLLNMISEDRLQGIYFKMLPEAAWIKRWTDSIPVVKGHRDLIWVWENNYVAWNHTGCKRVLLLYLVVLLLLSIYTAFN